MRFRAAGQMAPMHTAAAGMAQLQVASKACLLLLCTWQRRAWWLSLPARPCSQWSLGASGWPPLAAASSFCRCAICASRLACRAGSQGGEAAGISVG